MCVYDLIIDYLNEVGPKEKVCGYWDQMRPHWNKRLRICTELRSTFKEKLKQKYHYQGLTLGLLAVYVSWKLCLKITPRLNSPATTTATTTFERKKRKKEKRKHLS